MSLVATAFHPDYKMAATDRTSVSSVVKACEIGRAAGLNFVYAGNLPGQVDRWENTYCPGCETLLVNRYGFRLGKGRITDAGCCPQCGLSIPGISR